MMITSNIQKIKERGQKTQILGPVPAYISRIKNKYIFKILIKCENCDGITDVLSSAQESCEQMRQFCDVSIVIDRNPNMG